MDLDQHLLSINFILKHKNEQVSQNKTDIDIFHVRIMDSNWIASSLI